MAASERGQPPAPESLWTSRCGRKDAGSRSSGGAILSYVICECGPYKGFVNRQRACRLPSFCATGGGSFSLPVRAPEGVVSGNEGDLWRRGTALVPDKPALGRDPELRLREARYDGTGDGYSAGGVALRGVPGAVRDPRTGKPYTNGEVARMSLGASGEEYVPEIRDGPLPSPPEARCLSRSLPADQG